MLFIICHNLTCILPYMRSRISFNTSSFHILCMLSDLSPICLPPQIISSIHNHTPPKTKTDGRIMAVHMTTKLRFAQNMDGDIIVMQLK
ncbi:hypothetical protein ES319_D08G299500v1 [Gossypium barbadense]|uniref:Uncharacterized protein n=1 Tax=Gossypium barbadense TaxID=3634 RepID=A0A5J5QKH2_GOSBA|nr:hypothetical protein ES319_D08G299500v1 [Gossypium barbadense]